MSSTSSSSQINLRPTLNVSNKGLEQNLTRKQPVNGSGSNYGHPGFNLTAAEKAKRNRNFGIVRKPAPVEIPAPAPAPRSSTMYPSMGFKVPTIRPGMSIKLPAVNNSVEEENSEDNNESNGSTVLSSGENSNSNYSPFVVPNAFKPLSKIALSGYGTFRNQNPILKRNGGIVKKRSASNNNNGNKKTNKRRNLGLNKNKKFKRRGTRKN